MGFHWTHCALQGPFFQGRGAADRRYSAVRPRGDLPLNVRRSHRCFGGMAMTNHASLKEIYVSQMGRDLVGPYLRISNKKGICTWKIRSSICLAPPPTVIAIRHV